jgi:hypothetical protein
MPNITANKILTIFEAMLFTLKDLKDLENDSFNKEVARTARVLLDFEEEEPGSTDWFLNLANKTMKVVLKSFRGLYVNEKELKRRLLEGDLPENVKGFFPIPVYVSSSKSDKMTIGILVHYDGRLEMFEGNDEATPETVLLVNKLLGLGGKKATVFGMHTEDVVNKIHRTGKIPKGLYVSPSRKYASGHWRVGQQRFLFSCEIDMSDVSQESDYDWKVIRIARVKKIKFRIY